MDEDHSEIDFDLAIGAAPYYGIEKSEAARIADGIKSIVKNNWTVLAGKYGISHSEIERMKPAFQICGKN